MDAIFNDANLNEAVLNDFSLFNESEQSDNKSEKINKTDQNNDDQNKPENASETLPTLPTESLKRKSPYPSEEKENLQPVQTCSEILTIESDDEILDKVSNQKPLEQSETKISENDDDCLIVTGASNGADEPDSSDDEEKSTKSKKSAKSLKIPLEWVFFGHFTIFGRYLSFFPLISTILGKIGHMV